MCVFLFNVIVFVLLVVWQLLFVALSLVVWLLLLVFNVLLYGCVCLCWLFVVLFVVLFCWVCGLCVLVGLISRCLFWLFVLCVSSYSFSKETSVVWSLTLISFFDVLCFFGWFVFLVMFFVFYLLFY